MADSSLHTSDLPILNILLLTFNHKVVCDLDNPKLFEVQRGHLHKTNILTVFALIIVPVI